MKEKKKVGFGPIAVRNTLLPVLSLVMLQVFVLSSLIFCFSSFSVVLQSVLELAFVDQTGL